MLFHPFCPTILTQAITAWRSNPIARRIIEITTEFVLGEELFTDVTHHPAPSPQRSQGRGHLARWKVSYPKADLSNGSINNRRLDGGGLQANYRFRVIRLSCCMGDPCGRLFVCPFTH
jgi:hypothetical protein